MGETLEPITAEQMLEASASFSPTTALGWTLSAHGFCGSFFDRRGRSTRRSDRCGWVWSRIKHSLCSEWGAMRRGMRTSTA
eukprot:1974291-Pyramimonas_sp.AAC.1